MTNRAPNVLLAAVVMLIMASCATRPAIIGKWECPDETLEFCRDRTFVYVRGTGRVAIQHQVCGGEYQLTGADELKLTIRYHGRRLDTNGVILGALIWRVSIKGDELRTIRPDGAEQKWQRPQS
jgi:hypothetical protein